MKESNRSKKNTWYLIAAIAIIVGLWGKNTYSMHPNLSGKTKNNWTNNFS